MAAKSFRLEPAPLTQEDYDLWWRLVGGRDPRQWQQWAHRMFWLYSDTDRRDADRMHNYETWKRSLPSGYIGPDGRRRGMVNTSWGLLGWGDPARYVPQK